MVHVDGPVGLDGVAVCFDDERSVANAGIVLAATLRVRSGRTADVPGHRVMAPSTLGTFLRAFRFGHVGQLDRVLGEPSSARGRLHIVDPLLLAGGGGWRFGRWRPHQAAPAVRGR